MIMTLTIPVMVNVINLSQYAYKFQWKQSCAYEDQVKKQHKTQQKLNFEHKT